MDEPANMEQWYAENGRSWTLLLYAMITVLEERGEAELAEDLSRWLDHCRRPDASVLRPRARSRVTTTA